LTHWLAPSWEYSRLGVPRRFPRHFANTHIYIYYLKNDKKRKNGGKNKAIKPAQPKSAQVPQSHSPHNLPNPISPLVQPLPSVHCSRPSGRWISFPDRPTVADSSANIVCPPQPLFLLRRRRMSLPPSPLSSLSAAPCPRVTGSARGDMGRCGTPSTFPTGASDEPPPPRGPTTP
jgi:hypothetical protein